MNGLAKLADSSLGQDFLAGIDPTGVNTFQNALTNEDDHLKHQLVGDVGGFIGGGLVGTLAPAGLMGAAALGAKKFNPNLAEEFGQMGKGTLDALNPGAMKRYVSSLGDLTKFKNEGSNFLNDTKKLNSMYEGAKKGVAPNKEQMQEGYDIIKNLPKQQAKLNETEGVLSDKYFQGKPVSEGGARAFTALSTAGAGALSGGMGAMGAHMQYNTGKRVQDLNEQEQNKEATSIVEGLMKLANDDLEDAKVDLAGAGGSLLGAAGATGIGLAQNAKNVGDSVYHTTYPPGELRDIISKGAKKQYLKHNLGSPTRALVEGAGGHPGKFLLGLGAGNLAGQLAYVALRDQQRNEGEESL